MKTSIEPIHALAVNKSLPQNVPGNCLTVVEL